MPFDVHANWEKPAALAPASSVSLGTEGPYCAFRGHKPAGAAATIGSSVRRTWVPCPRQHLDEEAAILRLPPRANRRRNPQLKGTKRLLPRARFRVALLESAARPVSSQGQREAWEDLPRARGDPAGALSPRANEFGRNDPLWMYGIDKYMAVGLRFPGTPSWRSLKRPGANMHECATRPHRMTGGVRKSSGSSARRCYPFGEHC